MELANIRKAYFIGIKGAGMAAVAEILHARGIEVSGSDTNEKFFTDEILKKNKIRYFEKFAAGNVPAGAGLVIYSTAYNRENNAEVAEAIKRNLPLMSYPEILGELFKEKFSIAVCGTHGKTTTTAMLAEVLRYSGADPSAIVGSKVFNWDSSSLAGGGRFFVAEADEYQNKFQYYNPFAVVLTSVDWDHPDYFPDFKSYKKVFADFVARVPRHGFLVVWGDGASTNEVACSAQCEIIKYGFLEDNDVISSKFPPAKARHWQAGKIQSSKSNFKTQSFNVKFLKRDLGSFEIQLIGDHNILNATAVIAACYKLNINLDRVREALKNFKGTARRFEYIGQRNGAILIDDYAHHPEEIKATLKAAREIYPGKNIITVFHPHTYTRTKALLSEFSQSFNDTNEVIIIDIYGSAREAQGGVSSKELVDLINRYDHDKARYISTIDKVVEFLKGTVGENEVVISMGAGDVWKVADKLKEK